MELGDIPDQNKLFKHLLTKGYSQSLIDETVKLNNTNDSKTIINN